MVVRIGINGFGRIGRCVWRAAYHRDDVEIVAINDLADADLLAHLLRFDTIRRAAPGVIESTTTSLVVDGHEVPVTREPDIARLDWRRFDVDVVLDATGRFFRRPQLAGHLTAGARRVVVSAAISDADAVIMPGINDGLFDPARHHLISPGCCTANAAAPLLEVLRDGFGVRSAHLSSIHAYDNTHSSLHDFAGRRVRTGRAATLNIVPAPMSDTVAALTAVYPDLAGRLDGLVLRVPTAIGCLADLVVRVDQEPTVDEVNRALRMAAAGPLRRLLGYTEEPVVSSDIVGVSQSCVLDAELTAVVGDYVRLVGWYDNEWGYANRLIEIMSFVGGAVVPGGEPAPTQVGSAWA